MKYIFILILLLCGCNENRSNNDMPITGDSQLDVNILQLNLERNNTTNYH